MFKKCMIITSVLITVAVITFLASRQYMLKWGATKVEVERTMPGDELIPDSVMTSTRAIHIKVSPEKVWPWLVQMGQGRGGFYSYDWIENLAGLDIHNTDIIVPQWQNLKEGDLIPFWSGGGVHAMKVKPNQLLVLAGTFGGANELAQNNVAGNVVGGTWVFELKKVQDQTTQMVVRSRVAGFEPLWLSKIFMKFLEPVHFFMERKMLKGIKERAEKK